MSDHDERFVREIVGTLQAAGLDVWLGGGWAEELLGLRTPAPHKDIDLFLRAVTFDNAESVLERRRDFHPIAAKRFSHKRAFEHAGVMVELVLVDPASLATSYFDGRAVVRWPTDTFAARLADGFPVISPAALQASRDRFEQTAAARREHLGNGPGDDELMKLHVRTLFLLGEADDLVAVNERTARPAPSFYVGWTARGFVIHFRGDVPAARRRWFRDACQRARTADADVARCATTLAEQAGATDPWHGPAFVLASNHAPTQESKPIRGAAELGEHLSFLGDSIDFSQPCHGAAVEGLVVAVCHTARHCDRASEAGVFTLPDHRGRGLGAAACIAWANALMAKGSVPLYSTAATNGSSRRLAARLGLRMFGYDFHGTL